MSTAPTTAGSERPNRLAVQRLASEWVARELIEKIPEFADYAGREGFDQLVGHTLRAILHVGRDEKKRVAAAEHLAGATGVDASGRAAALIGGYKRLERDAEILLLGGWIRQVGNDPPFAAKFSVAVWKASNAEREREVVAFRTPELDAVGQVIVVPLQSIASMAAPVQIASWERLSQMRPVDDDLLPIAESRSAHWLVHHASYFKDLAAPARLAEIDAEFAAGAFKEMPAQDRFDHLRGLGAAIANAEGPEEMSVLLGRMSAIARVAVADDLEPAPRDDASPRP